MAMRIFPLLAAWASASLEDAPMDAVRASAMLQVKMEPANSAVASPSPPDAVNLHQSGHCAPAALQAVYLLESRDCIPADLQEMHLTAIRRNAALLASKLREKAILLAAESLKEKDGQPGPPHHEREPPPVHLEDMNNDYTTTTTTAANDNDNAASLLATQESVTTRQHQRPPSLEDMFNPIDVPTDAPDDSETIRRRRGRRKPMLEDPTTNRPLLENPTTTPAPAGLKPVTEAPATAPIGLKPVTEAPAAAPIQGLKPSGADAPVSAPAPSGENNNDSDNDDEGEPEAVSGVGESAPLDASGFLETTKTCCPTEMEAFFNRLLDSMDYDGCSVPHIQGLMHWFSCVPDMDFQYMITVIENGNPCKYWTKKGNECPVLSPECEGTFCR